MQLVDDLKAINVLMWTVVFFFSSFPFWTLLMKELVLASG